MKSPEWIRESLKLYFLNRPGVTVDTVDLVGYFHVASVLDAAQDLVDAGWLIRTGGVYPRFLRHCLGIDALGLMPRGWVRDTAYGARTSRGLTPPPKILRTGPHCKGIDA